MKRSTSILKAVKESSEFELLYNVKYKKMLTGLLAKTTMKYIHIKKVKAYPRIIHLIMQTSKMQNLARQVGQGTRLDSQVSGCC